MCVLLEWRVHRRAAGDPAACSTARGDSGQGALGSAREWRRGRDGSAGAIRRPPRGRPARASTRGRARTGPASARRAAGAGSRRRRRRNSSGPRRSRWTGSRRPRPVRRGRAPAPRPGYARRAWRRAYGRGVRVSNSASNHRTRCDAVSRSGPDLNILIPDVSVAEKLVRSVVVYLFLLVAFRLCGKRQLGQLSAFDLVVLLIISNVVQNPVIG